MDLVIPALACLRTGTSAPSPPRSSLQGRHRLGCSSWSRLLTCRGVVLAFRSQSPPAAVPVRPVDLCSLSLVVESPSPAQGLGKQVRHSEEDDITLSLDLDAI